MGRRCLLLVVSVLVLGGLIMPQKALSVETADGRFSLNGYFKNWTGWRWGAYDEERGEGLSIFRNTLQLEGEAKLNDTTSLYAIFRATKEAAYNLEDEAVELGNFDRDDLDEADFREYYIQSQITPRFWTAVGRQQVVWGDVAGFRVMDIINPLDLRWHFSLENWEDIRIPLHMINSILSIPEVNANVQLVWVPGIDEPYNRVNRSFSNPGHRWGVNNPPIPGIEPGTVLPVNEDPEADPPGISRDLEDGDVGLRWQQTVGGLTYALMGYYGHNFSPAFWYEQNPLLGGMGKMEHKRQFVVGGSFNWYDNVTKGVFRGEGGYFPEMPYTADKRLLIGGSPNPDFYHLQEEDTFKFALGYDRNTTFNWLSPTRSVLTQFQIIGTWIPGAEDLIVPGYDTEIKEWDFIFTFFVNWGWDQDHWQINISPAWNPDRKWGMVQGWLDFKPRWMNGLTITPKVNYFFGDDPWTGDFALVRGNSEVLMEVKYEF